jgi:hypothetical protein
MQEQISVYKWQMRIRQAAIDALGPDVIPASQIMGIHGRLKGACLHFQFTCPREVAKSIVLGFLQSEYAADNIQFWQEADSPLNYYATFDYNGRKAAHARKNPKNQR